MATVLNTLHNIQKNLSWSDRLVYWQQDIRSSFKIQWNPNRGVFAGFESKLTFSEKVSAESHMYKDMYSETNASHRMKMGMIS